MLNWISICFEYGYGGSRLHTHLTSVITPVEYVHVGLLTKTKSCIQCCQLTKPVCLPDFTCASWKKYSGNVVESIMLVRPLDLANHIVLTTFPMLEMHTSNQSNTRNELAVSTPLLIFSGCTRQIGQIHGIS